MNSKIRSFGSFIIFLFLAACGGGGGGSSDPSPPDSTVPDVAGTWEITETHTDDCDDGNTDVWTATVTQEGNSVTVTYGGVSRSGTMNGNVLTWSGSYPEDGGTTTVSSLTITFSGDTATGSATWSWTDGSSSCSGTTAISARRTSSGGGSVPDVAGTWEITETHTDDCDDGNTDVWTATITQDGSSVTVTYGGVSRTGTMNGNVLTWSGSYPEDGGTTTVSSLTITFSGDTASGSATWSWTDGSSSCSGTTSISAQRSSVGGGGDTPADFTGTWHIRDMVDASDCGEGSYLDAWTARVTQTGSAATVLDSEGNTFTATVSGDTASWSGSYPDDGGTTTITSASLTISGDSATGGANWTWSDGTQSCSGTTQTTATRGAALQEIEPNDDFDQANVITPSDGAAFLAGTVDSTVDEFDVYSFVLNSAAGVEFELSHFAGDLDLLLFDDTGTLIAASESATNPYEAIEISLAAGVIYYVVVRGFDTQGASAYEMSMDIN